MDKLEAMRALVAVVDQGSFVGAAVQLEQTKTRLSRLVSDLEMQLGVRLMQRTTRRLSLTEEGQLYLARCRDILQAISEAEEEAASRSIEPRGLLRISAPLIFGARYLAPLWARFAAEHPDIQLDIDLSDRKIDLIEDGFDLAIRISSHTPDSQLIVRPLCTARLLLCASPDYLATHAALQQPEDIASHAVIDYSYAVQRQQWLLQRGEEIRSTRFTPRLIANNGDVCRQFALAHLGLIRQPGFIVGEDIAAGRLVEILPDWRAGDVGIYALYPSRKHLPLKVRTMVDFLHAQLDAAAWNGQPSLA
ncbi:LysR family transcriptional regulator [Craterilacuibacter sp.]|uniref:LysR family transcriptional regulator n=1 Tax=Craterilacuibacter sp. TaxID=2870909 RepID=UPI003F3B98AA